jgi:hypothetical protein
VPSLSEVNASHPYTLESVRKFEDAPSTPRQAELSAIASQVAAQYRDDAMSPVMVSGYLRLAELVLFALSGIAIYGFYVGFGTYLAWEYPAAILSGSALAVILLELTDLYQIAALRRPSHYLRTFVIVWSGTFALMALTGFLLKISEEFSRVWFGSWFVAGLVLLISGRFALARLVRRWARNGRMERRHRRWRVERRNPDPFDRKTAL